MYAHAFNASGPTATYEAEGMRWANAGRPDHAVHLFAAALDLAPDDRRLRMKLADCLVRCNQLGRAADEYLRIALGYAADRCHAEAMAICHRVLQLDARPFVYVAVADMLRRMGRAARPLCAQAAEAHLAAGRLADGMNMLRLGAEIDGRNPDVRRRLARLCMAQHMTSDALGHLVEAARLLLAAGNNGEYVQVAEEILSLDPRHLETLRELPRVYLRLGEPQRAVTRLSALMRVQPGDTVGYEILAHAFATIGRTATSLSVLERLTVELRTTGRARQATEIITRALRWRVDDDQFVAAVAALRAPKAPPPPPPAKRRPTTAEGTVVLDIRDLISAAAPPAPPRAATPPPPPPPPASDIALDTSDMIEVDGGELDPNETLALGSSAVPELVRARPRSMPPVPRPRSARPIEEAEATGLIEVDGSELEDTNVRGFDLGDVTNLIFDDESAELGSDDDGDTLRVTAPLRRAAAPTASVSM